MKKTKLRIALAQINPTVGDLEGNRRKIAEYIHRAKAQQADIVAFPELAVTGYPPEDLLLKKHFVDDNITVLRSIVPEAKGITAIIGFVDKDTNGIYNAAAVIHDGKLKSVYRKNELPNYGVFDEKRYFTAGKENYVFTVGKVAFGVNICEDIWKKEGPHQAQAQAGASLLINISSSPYHAGKGKLREAMLRHRAKETKSHIVYVNLIGGQDELVFDGGSLVLNPRGEVLASGKPFAEDLLVFDISTAVIKKARKHKNVKTVSLVKSLPPEEKRPLLKEKPPRLSANEEIYKALVLGTRDYIQKNGFKKAVIGLSGGIDSAITAAIACDAIGCENIIGISMPSKFSSYETKNDAKILAQNLMIQFYEIPIESIAETYLTTLQSAFAGQKRDITEENLQARIRGNILMAFSNKFGWLVLTTGNKSEIATGYCTLYGDMAGGFAVIKDVPKTKIYDLAHFRNKKEGRALIPQSVLDRAPTAELRENQKDEDSLPPYPVLDPVIKDYVEEDKGFADLIKKNDANLIRRVVDLVDKSEYKRRQAPPGVKITPKAFGRDRRLPMTNRYKER